MTSTYLPDEVSVRDNVAVALPECTVSYCRNSRREWSVPEPEHWRKDSADVDSGEEFFWGKGAGKAVGFTFVLDLLQATGKSQQEAFEAWGGLQRLLVFVPRLTTPWLRKTRPAAGLNILFSSLRYILPKTVRWDYGGPVDCDSTGLEEPANDFDAFPSVQQRGVGWDIRDDIKGLEIGEKAKSYIRQRGLQKAVLVLRTIAEHFIAPIGIQLSLTEFDDLSDIHIVKVRISAGLDGTEAVEMEDAIEDKLSGAIGLEKAHCFMVFVE